MRIVILGAGAMGSILGAYLAQGGAWIGRIKALLAPPPWPRAPRRASLATTSCAPSSAPPARYGSPLERPAAGRSAAHCGLDRPRRIGEGDAARGVRGDGLGKGGEGSAPDVVLACCGAVPTLATLAAVELLRTYAPDLAVLHALARFPLVADVIDRVPQLGARAAYAKQAIRDKLLEHTQYIAAHGEDLPEVRHWRWSGRE